MIAPITRIIASTENARGVSAMVIIRIAQLILILYSLHRQQMLIKIFLSTESNCNDCAMAVDANMVGMVCCKYNNGTDACRFPYHCPTLKGMINEILK